MKGKLKSAALASVLSAAFIYCGTTYAAPGPQASQPPVYSASPAPEITAMPDVSPEPEASAAAEAAVQTAGPEETDLPESTEPADNPVRTAEPTYTPSSGAPTASTLDFTIQISKKKHVIESTIKIEVYDKTGALAGSGSEHIGAATESINMHLDVPEYALGDSFTVKLADGAQSLQYYDTVTYAGKSFEITTDWYRNASGAVVPYNSYIFTAVPLWEKDVVVYVGGDQPKLPDRARIVDGNTLVPVRAVAEAMGISVYYDKSYDSVVCSVGDKQIIYNMNSTYATFFGEDIYLPTAPRYFSGSAYVPVRSLAEAFEAPIESKDYGDHLDIIIGESETVKQYEPVNKWNISSRTDYMIWVSKSEYTVRVYQGYENHWRRIYTAPCAIGAPGTPTITGSFEYIEITARIMWDPCFVFITAMRCIRLCSITAAENTTGGSE